MIDFIFYSLANVTSAVWAAIAASFAALSSFLIMLIQKQALLESVRPELVLTGWNRQRQGNAESQHDVITFLKVKNVGRGVAFHVNVFSLTRMVQNKPTAVMSNIRLPLIAPTEEAEVEGRILVRWKNIDGGDKGFKHLPIDITILCWDSRGRRHETKYGILAMEPYGQTLVSDEMAPGVMFGTRRTTIRPVWVLKLKRKLGRVPLLGKPFRDKVV